jgi:cytochrome c biogenesis protein
MNGKQREKIEKDRTKSLKELGGFSLWRYLWRLLTSMRTALILLMLVGVASIPGSIIPQRSQNPFEVSDFFDRNPSISPWLDRFYFFDVFGSPWFSSIYVLLFISLIGCVIPRLNEYRQAIFEKPPPPPQSLQLMKGFQSFDSDSIGADKVLILSWLKKKGFRTEEFDGAITAEKGYLKESGNLIFHFAMILILIGIAVSSIFGMRGDSIVNIGERFQNTPTSYDSMIPGRFYSVESLQPFQIKVDSFLAEYDPLTNQALNYELKVIVREELDSLEEEKVVRVNQPLTFGATRVFLQATGYSPQVTVRDGAGEVTFKGAVAFLPQDPNLTSAGAIKVPDMEPPIGFVGSFIPTAARDEVRGAFSAYPEVLDPRLLLAVWQGDLGMDDGKPQSIYRLDIENMERIGLKALRLGESYDFKVGSITFDGYLPWVNLQIIHDPGKKIALSGGLFALIGALGMLFIHRRRIWIRFSEENSVQLVDVAGFSSSNEELLLRELREFQEFLTLKKGES